MAADRVEEWLKQAEYDMETAEVLLRSRRHLHAVFMLHLSIEKALKGLYQQRLGDMPPRVHNLILLVNRMALELPDDFRLFVTKLNDLSVATRYPDEIASIQAQYPKGKVKEFLGQGREVLAWIRSQC
jgi:HEPN domain-containing protein